MSWDLDFDDRPEPREDGRRCQSNAGAAKLEKDFCRQEVSQVGRRREML